MSPPPSFLDDKQIEQLGELLEQRAVPFKGLNLEALDGFLSALVVGPALVMPSEWNPLVWGGQPPRWNDEKEAFEVQQLLMGHWNMCVARAQHDPEQLPDHLAPLMWLPEDPEQDEDAMAESDLDVGCDWALGFFTGVMLREAEWDQWLDEHEWIEEIFDLLDQLASGERIDPENLDAEPVKVSYRERLDICMELPAMLADLNHHRNDAMTPRTPIRREEEPGRNDACSCGSGKKYKKCCGLN